MDVLQATVEGRERLRWNGDEIDTLVVVYRADPGATFGAARLPRGKVWVDGSGTVLRQEIVVFESKLAFLRLPTKAESRHGSSVLPIRQPEDDSLEE
jgi:hypothetical protein